MSTAKGDGRRQPDTRRTGARRRFAGDPVGRFRLDRRQGRDAYLTNRDAGIEAIRRPAKHLDGALWRIDDLVLPAPGNLTAKVDVLITDFDQVSLEQSFTVPPVP